MRDIFDINNVATGEIDLLRECGLALRANVNSGLIGSAANELRVYYTLMAITAQQLKGKFTSDELNLLVHFNSGEAKIGQLSLAAVPSASRPVDQLADYEREFHADVSVIAEKLASLTLVEQFALADAITVFWQKLGSRETVEIADLFDLDPDSLELARTKLDELKSFVYGDSRHAIHIKERN